MRKITTSARGFRDRQGAGICGGHVSRAGDSQELESNPEKGSRDRQCVLVMESSEDRNRRARRRVIRGDGAKSVWQSGLPGDRESPDPTPCGAVGSGTRCGFGARPGAYRRACEMVLLPLADRLIAHAGERLESITAVRSSGGVRRKARPPIAVGVSHEATEPIGQVLEVGLRSVSGSVASQVNRADSPDLFPAGGPGDPN
jgi:hypothetical protein